MRKSWIITLFVLLLALAVLPQWNVLSARVLQIVDSTPVFLPMMAKGQDQAPTPTPPGPTPTPPGRRRQLPQPSIPRA